MLGDKTMLMKQKESLLTLLLEGVNVNNFDSLYPYVEGIEDAGIVSELKRALEDFNWGTSHLGWAYEHQCDTTASHGWSHINAAVECLQQLAEQLAKELK